MEEFTSAEKRRIDHKLYVAAVRLRRDLIRFWETAAQEGFDPTGSIDDVPECLREELYRRQPFRPGRWVQCFERYAAAWLRAYADAVSRHIQDCEEYDRKLRNRVIPAILTHLSENFKTALVNTRREAGYHVTPDSTVLLAKYSATQARTCGPG
jgi:hypothetical protein